MAALLLAPGVLGVLCIIMGIISAAEVTVPGLGIGFSATFWLLLAMALFLSSIAFLTSFSRYE